MKLKKLLATGLAAIMVMGLVGCSSSKGSDSSSEGSTATTDKLQQIKDAGVLKVGTSAEYSPYEFHKVVDGEDKIVGFDDFVVQEIIKAIIKGIDTPGYSSLMCVMLFLGGIQLIFLGIIGEYLGKTYNETKRRPIYIAKEEIGFDEDYL